MSTTKVSFETEIEDVGTCIVTGSRWFYKGSTDGRGGPPLEPDDYGCEVESVIGPDGKEVPEDKITEADYERWAAEIMEHEDEGPDMDPYDD